MTKCKKINKKAQTEIFGLVFIVIIILIVIVYATYSFGSKNNTRTMYVTKTIAQNYLSSLMVVDSKCDDYSFSELIENCALKEESARKKCISINTDRVDSCAYSKQVIESILTKSIKKWGLEYRFYVKTNDGNTVINILSGRTLENKEQGIDLRNGYNIYLDIYY